MPLVLPVTMVLLVLKGLRVLQDRKGLKETKAHKVLLGLPVQLVMMVLLGRKVLKVLPDHKGIKGHKV